MKIFKLPDLGEGLKEAEISAWHVNEGDHVVTDQPLVAVETDKAVVDVPSPRAGRIVKLHGRVGEIIAVGAPLVEFEEGEAVGSDDSGTVVGEVARGEEVVTESATAVGADPQHDAVRVRATPAVRALARQLDVDLSVVTPSGPNDTILKTDVERVARLFAAVGPLERLRGPRRAMALAMTQARDEVMHAALFEDADVHAWAEGNDPMVRLIRALCVGVAASPAVNAWYDSHAVGRRVLEKVDLGIAVDTPDGLFVPVLRDAGNRDAAALRRGLDELIAAVRDRTIPASELRGNTITLSNFGTLAGRYAVPVVVPPTVAIVGSGAIREQVVARDGEVAVRRILPLSVSFDHRALTGGEVARFLAAMVQDLNRGE